MNDTERRLELGKIKLKEVLFGREETEIFTD